MPLLFRTARQSRCKTRLTDHEESLKERLQFFDDGLLFLRTAAAIETGYLRQQFADIRVCRFDRAVTEVRQCLQTEIQ